MQISYVSIGCELLSDIDDVTDVSRLPYVAFLQIQQNHVTFILVITWTSVQTGSGSDVTSGHQLTNLE